MFTILMVNKLSFPSTESNHMVWWHRTLEDKRHTQLVYNSLGFKHHCGNGGKTIYFDYGILCFVIILPNRGNLKKTLRKRLYF